MANKLQITITAIDKATAVVRSINGSMNKLTQPAVKLGESMRAFGREMGFDRLGRSIGDVGRSVSDVGSRLTAMLAPLGIITGAGMIAALAALTVQWGQLGSAVGRTAQGLDMQVGQLQALRGAAGAAGVSADEMSGSLKSMGATLEDALVGRNMEAAAVLQKLRVGIHQTANGSIDAARGFHDLAEAIASIKNVQGQQKAAGIFGLEAVLPLIRKGPAAIEALQAKLVSLGAVMSDSDTASADKFRESMFWLDSSVEGLRNSIGAKLAPVIGPLVDQFTGWIAANRELIATKVADFVKGLADRIKDLDFKRIGDDVHSFVSGIQSVVDAMGGWKNAAIGVVVVLNGSLIASVLNLAMSVTSLGVTSIPIVIRALGLLRAGAAGTMLKTALLTDGLAGLASGVPIVGTVLSGLSSAFLAVGAAIEATPIGWILTAIAALGAATYVVYKNWEPIKKFFSDLWDDIGHIFDGGISRVIDKMKTLFKYLPLAGFMAGGLSDAWNATFKGDGKGAAPAPSPSAASPASVSAPAAAARAVQTSAPASGRVPNNNPGNLREWGDAPRAGGYAVFPTVQDGLNAAARNLLVQQQAHGLGTIRGIVNKWAPASENNTAAYISDVSNRTGFNPDQQLNLQDPQVLAPLLSSIVRHEGNGAGVTQEMINSAVSSQLGASVPGSQASPQKLDVVLTLHGLPAGVTASARTGSGDSMPVRVAYSMPTGVTP